MNAVKQVVVCLLLLACLGCAQRHRTGSAGLTNAVDAVVSPETDMRKKTHRSQEHPRNLDETENEEEGDSKEDNTA